MSGRLALVSGHFPPSNLVGAQRARLWSRYLPEFGWEPIVVTGDPDAYEEKPDPDLEHLGVIGDQGDESRSDHDLVGKRVKEHPHGGDLTALAGEVSIDSISDGRQHEEDGLHVG